MSPLFTYVPIIGAHKDKNTPSTLIMINATNVAFSDVIPPKYRKIGLESFVEFLKGHPLRYTLADCVDLFFPYHVCELYYTYTYDH